jgi:hypothetical protein
MATGTTSNKETGQSKGGQHVYSGKKICSEMRVTMGMKIAAQQEEERIMRSK